MLPGKPAIQRLFIPFSCLLFLLVYFLICFPLREWGSYITVDDYPVFFAMAKRGCEMLKQGGYYGWDSSFVGGYFTAAESGTNLIHLLLPFSIIGWQQGFHLMLFFGVLCFPVLCFYYITAYLRVDRDKAFIALPVATVFVLMYFKQILRTGAVTTFMGINLLLLALALLGRLKEGKRYSFFFLVLTLTALFYTHFSTFLYCLAFIAIDFAFSPNKKYFKQLCLLAAAVFVTSLPFLAYIFRYGNYIILDNYSYSPAGFLPHGYAGLIAGKASRFVHSIFKLSLWRWDELFWVLAIALYMLNKKAWRKPAVSALFTVVMLKIFNTEGVFLLISRGYYIVTISFLAILLSGLLINGYEKKRRFLSVMIFAVFVFHFDPFVLPRHFPHGRPGRFYNPALVEKIKSLEGRYIAVENNQHGNHVGADVIPIFHWLPLLQLETHKLLFSNFHDGYHHTPWRVNSLEGGYFRDKTVDKWPAGELNGIFRRWGVGYIVAWNGTTKAHLLANPGFFENIWHDRCWIIFKVKGCDTKSAVVDDGGSAELIDRDFYEKLAVLTDVRQGSKVVLRSNYFPAWRAYYKSREVPLVDVDGQAGFFAPDSGSYVVTMKFPRYAALNILAFLALAFSGFLSYKNYEKQ